MVRVLLLIVVFQCTLPAQTSLSGKVTDSDGKGLAGVTLTLKKLSSVTATSGEDGSFSLSTGTAVTSHPHADRSMRFDLHGTTILFHSPSRDLSGNMAIFSGNGRLLSLTTFASSSGEPVSTKLPDLSSGMYLLRITVNDREYTRSLVCMGEDLYLEQVSDGPGGNGDLTLLKQSAAAVVDTIIASKTGYITVNQPVGSYSMQDIRITMTEEAAGGACTREVLQKLVDGFIAALEAADPDKMTLADGAVYSENMKASSFNAGVWKTKLKVGLHRDFLDIDSCKIFTEVMDYESADPHEVGAQITVKDGKISQINALVSSVGDWALDDKSSFKFRYDIASKEKWGIIPDADRDDRETIQAAGDAYLDLFNDTSVEVPWGKPCGRLEGGMYTGNKNNLDDPNQSCNVGVPSGVMINARTYVVDVELGTVSILCKFGGAMPDSHLFRIESGKLRYVHTISIN
ncbi:MAG: T9SS type A sorting domain-containing protein [Chitinispirillaceae bacterium]|nr:T9SS type A sorting domain-containing protein [Chitinispirillaceae bacterium]